MRSPLDGRCEATAVASTSADTTIAKATALGPWRSSARGLIKLGVRSNLRRNTRRACISAVHCLALRVTVSHLWVFCCSMADILGAEAKVGAEGSAATTLQRVQRGRASRVKVNAKRMRLATPSSSVRSKGLPPSSLHEEGAHARAAPPGEAGSGTAAPVADAIVAPGPIIPDGQMPTPDDLDAICEALKPGSSGHPSTSEEDIRRRSEALIILARLLDVTAEGAATVALCKLSRDRGLIECVCACVAHDDPVMHQTALMLLANYTTVEVDMYADETKLRIKLCNGFELVADRLFSQVALTVAYASGTVQNTCDDIFVSGRVPPAKHAALAPLLRMPPHGAIPPREGIRPQRAQPPSTLTPRPMPESSPPPPSLSVSFPILVRW